MADPEDRKDYTSQAFPLTDAEVIVIKELSLSVFKLYVMLRKHANQYTGRVETCLRSLPSLLGLKSTNQNYMKARRVFGKLRRTPLISDYKSIKGPDGSISFMLTRALLRKEIDDKKATQWRPNGDPIKQEKATHSEHLQHIDLYEDSSMKDNKSDPSNNFYIDEAYKKPDPITEHSIKLQVDVDVKRGCASYQKKLSTPLREKPSIEKIPMHSSPLEIFEYFCESQANVLDNPETPCEDVGTVVAGSDQPTQPETRVVRTPPTQSAKALGLPGPSQCSPPSYAVMFGDEEGYSAPPTNGRYTTHANTTDLETMVMQTLKLRTVGLDEKIRADIYAVQNFFVTAKKVNAKHILSTASILQIRAWLEKGVKPEEIMQLVREVDLFKSQSSDPSPIQSPKYYNHHIEQFLYDKKNPPEPTKAVEGNKSKSQRGYNYGPNRYQKQSAPPPGKQTYTAKKAGERRKPRNP